MSPIPVSLPATQSFSTVGRAPARQRKPPQDPRPRTTKSTVIASRPCGEAIQKPSPRIMPPHANTTASHVSNPVSLPATQSFSTVGRAPARQRKPPQDPRPRTTKSTVIASRPCGEAIQKPSPRIMPPHANTTAPHISNPRPAARDAIVQHRRACSSTPTQAAPGPPPAHHQVHRDCEPPLRRSNPEALPTHNATPREHHRTAHLQSPRHRPRRDRPPTRGSCNQPPMRPQSPLP
jgi:hypothetical protein